MLLSPSQENYLKAIYKLQEDDGIATNQALAALVEAAPASVTNMLRKLTDTGYDATASELDDLAALHLGREMD